MKETKIIGSDQLEDIKDGYSIEFYQLEEERDALLINDIGVISNKQLSKKAIGIKVFIKDLFYFNGLSELELRICQEGNSLDAYKLYQVDNLTHFKESSRKYVSDIFARAEYIEEEKYYYRYINLVKYIHEPNKVYHFIIDQDLDTNLEYNLKIYLTTNDQRSITITREYRIDTIYPKIIKYDKTILNRHCIYENLYNLKIQVENNLVNYNGKDLSMHLSLIYDGNIRDINYEYQDNYYKLPYGWNFNYQQRVIKNKNMDTYLYIDARCNRYYFKKVKEKFYIEENGTGLILKVEDSAKTIKTLQNVEYVFNNDGYLKSIYNGKNSLRIYYDDKINYGKVLRRIKDSSGKEININYFQDKIEITRNDLNKIVINIKDNRINDVIYTDGSKVEYGYSGILLSKIIDGINQLTIARNMYDVTLLGRYVNDSLKNEKYYRHFNTYVHVIKSTIHPYNTSQIIDAYYFKENGDYYKCDEVVKIGNENKYYGQIEDKKDEYTKTLEYDIDLVMANIVPNGINIYYDPEYSNPSNYYVKEYNEVLEAGNYKMNMDAFIPYGSSFHMATDQEIKIIIYTIDRIGIENKIDEFNLDVNIIEERQNHIKDITLTNEIVKFKIQVYTYKMLSLLLYNWVFTKKTKTLPICYINKEITSTLKINQFENPILNSIYYIDRPRISIYAIKKPLAIEYIDENGKKHMIEGSIDISKNELIENIKNYNNYKSIFWYNGFKNLIQNYKRSSIKIKYGIENDVTLDGLEVIDYVPLYGIHNYTIYTPSKRTINGITEHTMLIKTYANVVDQSDILGDQETYIFKQVEINSNNKIIEDVVYGYNRRVITRYEYNENGDVIKVKSGAFIDNNNEFIDLAQDLTYTYDPNTNYITKMLNKTNNHISDEIQISYDEIGNVLTYKPVIGNTINYNIYNDKLIHLRQQTEEMWLENRISYNGQLVETLGHNRIGASYKYEYNEDETIKKVLLQSNTKDVLLEKYYIYNSNDNCEFEVGKDNVAVVIEYGNLQKIAYIYDKYQRLIVKKEYENNNWFNLCCYIYAEEDLNNKDSLEISSVYEIDSPFDNILVQSRTALLRKKIDYVTNIKEEYHYNEKEQLIKIIKKDINNSVIEEIINKYVNDVLVETESKRQTKKYYYDQWQNIGKETIILKNKNEVNLELTLCYERNVIGSLESISYIFTKINQFQVDLGFIDLNKVKEEYAYYLENGIKHLDYNNMPLKKTSAFSKEEEIVTYANSGQIVQINDSNNKLKKEYEYNNLSGTLKQEYNVQKGQFITYMYEDVNNFGGNILSKKMYNLDFELQTNIEYIYEMPYIDILRGVIINNKEYRFEYDEALNLISYKGNNLTWTRGRVLKSFQNNNKSIQFVYDSNNIRIEKKDILNLETTKYEIDKTRILTETKIVNNNILYTITYIYSEKELVGFEICKDSIRKYYIYEKDMEQNVVGLYEMNNYYGDKVASYVYDAYGNHIVLDDKNQPNHTNSFIGNINPVRYKGYYYDEETELFYCNSRYYSPELCRWISPDSIEYLDPQSINGLNLYCYCYNNPVNYKQRPVSSNGSVVRSSISSISNGGIYSSSSISSGSVGSSRVNWENGGFQIPIWISSLMSGSDFGAMITPVLRTIYQYIRYPGVKDLNKLYGLDFVPGKLNTVCSVIGYGLLGLNIGLSAWSNFTNDNLTTKQQWISFGVDTAYTLGTFGIGYGVGALVSLIPGVGVFIAPFVSAGVTWFIDWTNEKWGWLDDVKQWFNDL